MIGTGLNPPLRGDLLNPSGGDANPGTNRCYILRARGARRAGLYSLCSQVSRLLPFSVMLLLMQKSDSSSANRSGKSVLSKRWRACSPAAVPGQTEPGRTSPGSTERPNSRGRAVISGRHPPTPCRWPRKAALYVLHVTKASCAGARRLAFLRGRRGLAAVQRSQTLGRGRATSALTGLVGQAGWLVFQLWWVFVNKLLLPVPWFSHSTSAEGCG